MRKRLNKEEKLARRQRRRRMTVKVLPSLFTIGNLLCGFAAIFFASRGAEATKPFGMDHLSFASCLIFVGMAFDALDGRVARMTRSTSELGEQLDSMADMVTFGAAPAFIVIQLANIGSPFFGSEMTSWERLLDRAALLITFAYVACTALRLARFNAELDNPEESDHMSFKGLPSPAAAGTVASLVLLYEDLLGRQSAFAKPAAVCLVVICLIVALAMVSNLRYSHLLNRYFRGRAGFHYVAAIVIAGIAMLLRPQLSIALAFVVYGLSAPVVYLIHRLRTPHGPVPASDTVPQTGGESSPPPPTSEAEGADAGTDSIKFRQS